MILLFVSYCLVHVVVEQAGALDIVLDMPSKSIHHLSGGFQAFVWSGCVRKYDFMIIELLQHASSSHHGEIILQASCHRRCQQRNHNFSLQMRH
jgi:hypothetical protein